MVEKGLSPPATLPSESSSPRADGMSSARTRPYLVPFVQTKMNGNVRKPAAPFSALPRESEDARITGATRSLDRRLLALNIYGTLVRSVTVDSRIA
jgi:hypothetical protein